MDFNKDVFFKESEWQNYDLVQQFDKEIKESTQLKIIKAFNQLMLAVFSGIIAIIFSIITEKKEANIIYSLLWACFITLVIFATVNAVYYYIVLEIIEWHKKRNNRKSTQDIKKMVYNFKYKIVPEVLLCEQTIYNVQKHVISGNENRPEVLKYHIFFILDTLFSCLNQLDIIDSQIIRDIEKNDKFFYEDVYAKHKINTNVFYCILNILDKTSVRLYTIITSSECDFLTSEEKIYILNQHKIISEDIENLSKETSIS